MTFVPFEFTNLPWKLICLFMPTAASEVLLLLIVTRQSETRAMKAQIKIKRENCFVLCLIVFAFCFVFCRFYLFLCRIWRNLSITVTTRVIKQYLLGKFLVVESYLRRTKIFFLRSMNKIMASPAIIRVNIRIIFV